MEKFDEILNQLKDASGQLKANLHIMEEIISIDEQIYYFNYSKAIRKAMLPISDIQTIISDLFSPDHDTEDKRKYLVLLASSVEVIAYRAIETYKSSPLEPELENWAAMALTESRILLDSELSGEKQIFISTGLGGHNGKLRFFGIIPSNNRLNFNTLQKDVIGREFNFQFTKYGVDIERFELSNNYLKILVLSNMKIDIRFVIKHAIDECNEFGHFLDEHFLLTNMKQLDDIEINNLLTVRDKGISNN